MAKSSWSYLKGERRIGEYEELTLRSVGHWWIGDDPQWPEAVREAFHVRSETGIDIVEPTRLHLADRGAYRDPFKLTYRSYNLQQDGEEKKLDGLIEGARAADAFAGLDAARHPGLAAVLGNYIPGMRHAFWGFSLLQTYGAAYTPAGTAMNVLQFQAFDCMRHAQRFVELAWELPPGAAAGAAPEPWMTWAPLQPLRRFVEMSLCNFDWAENLVLLNHVLLPLFQPAHHALMVDIPRAHDDWVLPQYWLRLEEDMKRHMAQGRAFTAAVIKHDERNRAIVQDWIDRWQAPAQEAADALGPVIDAAAGAPTYAGIRDGALAAWEAQLAECGLQPAAAGAAPTEGGRDVAIGVPG